MCKKTIKIKREFLVPMNLKSVEVTELEVFQIWKEY